MRPEVLAGRRPSENNLPVVKYTYVVSIGGLRLAESVLTLLRMSWPFTAKAAEQLEPPIAPPVEAAAHADMVAAKKTLDTLNVEIRHFRTKHSIETDRLNRIVRCCTTGFVARAEIEAYWQLLQKRTNRALHDWSRTQKLWSDAKGAAK
jgi:hypothetical protein